MDNFTRGKTYILFLANVFPEDCSDDIDVLEKIGDEYTENTSMNINDPVEILEESDSEDSSSVSPVSDEELPNLFGCTDSNILSPRHPLYEKCEDQPDENTSGINEEYDSIPEYFIDIDSWPKSVNTLCWNCNLKIYGPPYFSPIGKVKKSVKSTESSDSSDTSEMDECPNLFDNVADFTNVPDVYQTPSRTREVQALLPHGRFCTEKCAQRYINRVKDPKIKNTWESTELLKYLYEKMTGKVAQYIPEAEDPKLMMQFYGPKGITVQEYRERNENKKVILLEKI